MIHFARDAIAPPVPAAFTQRRRVRFQDIDAAGIIFFPRVLEYFHDAYVEWMDARGLDFSGAIATRRWGAPMRHVEASYLRPMRFGDDVAVEIVGAHQDDTQVWLAYRIVGTAGLLAFGQAHHVFVDMSAFKRTTMPADVHTAFASLPRLATTSGG